MDLTPHDLHFVFDETARRVKAFDAAQRLVWSAEMRNSTVADGQYGHWGNINSAIMVASTWRVPYNRGMGKPPSIPLIPGQRFGRLVVLSLAEGQPRQFVCRCDCGNLHHARPTHLVHGLSRSCGCLQVEMTVARSTRHGRASRGALSPEYITWVQMIQRCENTKRERYPRYGGRGITICQRWRTSFAAFYEDMGDRPSEQHSLDRIDNDGNYGPENCRWATNTIQGRNRDQARIIVANGEARPLAEWAEITGLDRKTITSRIDRLGWTPDEAFSRPAGPQGQRKKSSAASEA